MTSPGYAATVAVVAGGLLLAAVPLARRGPAGVVSWLLSAVVNESPFLGLEYLLVCTIPPLVGDDWPDVRAWFVAGACMFVVSPVLLARASRARGALETALDGGLGAGWRDVVAPARATWRRRLPWLRIVVAPVPVLGGWSRTRRRHRYGPHRRQRLDVHAARRAPAGPRPVLVHVHGGGFRSGRPSLYARPLLHAFADHGWVAVSAGHRLRPAPYADMLADVASAVAWVRSHAGDLGADPDRIVLAGSSSGAHLALTAALTADPGVRAAVGLYGYYGPADRPGVPSRPSAYVHRDAPPVMLVHGGQDTFVPPAGATALAGDLRAGSRAPVVHAELPGAQHTFDLVHSVRFEQVVDAVWAFATWAVRR